MSCSTQPNEQCSWSFQPQTLSLKLSFSRTNPSEFEDRTSLRGVFSWSAMIACWRQLAKLQYSLYHRQQIPTHRSVLRQGNIWPSQTPYYSQVIKSSGRWQSTRATNYLNKKQPINQALLHHKHDEMDAKLCSNNDLSPLQTTANARSQV